GVPVLAVTAVGRDMVRDARDLPLPCRICAELGAQFVKTYYVEEGVETVTASCPVPIIMAGGEKIPPPHAPPRGLQRGGARGPGRRHGPEHLPVRCAGRDDPGRARGGARSHEAAERARAVPGAEPAGQVATGQL